MTKTMYPEDTLPMLLPPVERTKKPKKIKNLKDPNRHELFSVHTLVTIAVALLCFLLGAFLSQQYLPTGPVRTVIQIKKVDVTPTVCLNALNEADQGFKYAANFGGTFGDFVTAIKENNSAGVDQVNINLQNISTQMDSLTTQYDNDESACRAAR